jgi:hypothetical protein
VEVKLPVSTTLTTEYRPDFLGGTTVIRGNRADGGTFTAIPFFAMANRGKSKQMVWLPQEGLKNVELNSTGPLYWRVPASGTK